MGASILVQTFAAPGHPEHFHAPGPELGYDLAVTIELRAGMGDDGQPDVNADPEILVAISVVSVETAEELLHAVHSSIKALLGEENDNVRVISKFGYEDTL